MCTISVWSFFIFYHFGFFAPYTKGKFDAAVNKPTIVASGNPELFKLLKTNKAQFLRCFLLN